MQPTSQDQREEPSDGSTGDSTADSTAERSAEVTVADGAALDLAILEGLAERPLQEHAEVYDQVHVRLQGALREIDDA